MGVNHSRDRDRGGGGGGGDTRGNSGRHSRTNTQTDNQVLFGATIMLQRQDKPCPVCRKIQRADEYELHVVCCMTKPRLEFNHQVLEKNEGECLICYDDLEVGDRIARLPCLCIYHTHCIEAWFKRKEECPKHPAD